MLKRVRAIVYLTGVFLKERPRKFILPFFFKLCAIPTAELIRIADAIERFGFDNLI